MSQMPSRVGLVTALVIAIAAVSTASILIRLAQQDAPSMTIAALRLGFATLLLAPAALLRHRPELRALRLRDCLLAAASGCFLALHFGTWISSLEYTKVASSVVLVSTGPIWVGLLSPILLHERVAPRIAIGLGLAVFGGIVIALGDTCVWRGGIHCMQEARGSGANSLWGNFLALAGAWAVSGYLIIGRRLRATLSLLPYIFLVYGFAAVALLAASLAAGRFVLDIPARAYGWIVLLAVVPQIIGHSTYNWALRYLPAALVAVTTLGEPVGSAILAHLILDESPGPIVVSGAALIMAGIYVAALSGRAPKDAQD